MRGFSIESLSAALLFGLLVSPYAKADSMPTATFTVSGSANDWTLDFTVTNNTGQGLYFFGVQLPPDITGLPSGWVNDGSWNTGPTGGGGPNITFQNTWVTTVDNTAPPVIAPGASLGGFTVMDTTDATAPSSEQFFAYTLGSPFGVGEANYTGTNNFNGTLNPGFEGTASGPVSPVPEPGSIILLLTGLALLGVVGGVKRLWRGSPAIEA